MKTKVNWKSIAVACGAIIFTVAVSSCGGGRDAYGCPNKITQVPTEQTVA